jgi:UDPglucose--hexose-1-phosphate uridylyltransferase
MIYKSNKSNKSNRSELRQDLVSGDWILIAPKRGKKPQTFLADRSNRTNKTYKSYRPKKNCPFENPLKSHKPILVYESKRGWELVVVENKYPAVVHHKVCADSFRDGPYLVAEGIGHHDVIITRDHDKNFVDLKPSQANQVFEAFRDRYLMLLDDPCLAYISIFHNWGPAAGASVYHPHYQLLALPVVPPDIKHSLTGSLNYFKKYRRCVHCDIISYEQREKKRIIYENDGAVVFTPFVSREPFELRIFPQKHLPYFENTLDLELGYAVEALQTGLRKIKSKLSDPDYNFFIHTAPIQNKNKYKNYHWHIEVIPKTNISAGFELGTGIEINPVDPDEAAKILKK